MKVGMVGPGGRRQVAIRAGVVLSGRFKLRRNLGTEDAATLWEAIDTTLDRPVLVRVLRADLATDPNAIDQFRHDVRIAARTDLSLGARVLDAGSDATTNLPFAVFEWLEQMPEEPLQTIRPATPRSSRPGVAPQGSGLSPQSLILALVLVPVVVGALLIRAFLQLDQAAPVAAGLFSLPSAEAATPVASSVPASAPTVAPQAASRSLPTATSAAPRPTMTPLPQSGGDRRRIANTDGIGVALRATPGGDKLPGKGYDEGVSVSVLEVQSPWAHIRGDDGREGWVLAVTLVPE